MIRFFTGSLKRMVEADVKVAPITDSIKEKNSKNSYIDYACSFHYFMSKADFIMAVIESRFKALY
ncbi:hypothetical protein JCM19376_41810 [Fusibacter bizertensis]